MNNSLNRDMVYFCAFLSRFFYSKIVKKGIGITNKNTIYLIRKLSLHNDGISYQIKYMQSIIIERGKAV